MLRDRARSSGFTYIGLLIFIALMGIGLALAGQVWHAAAHREKENELLFAGNQLRSAIARFYEGSPGGMQKFPGSLNELLDDQRFPTRKRHLRRLYRDPMTGSTEWGLVTAQDGSIMGVYSLSRDAPRKISGFRAGDEIFADALHYSDWKFVHALPDAATTVAGTPGAGEPGLPGATPPPPGPGEPIVVEPPPKPPTKCERLSAIDQAGCTTVEARWSLTDGDLCRSSAAIRLAACDANQPIPPLHIRYQ